MEEPSSDGKGALSAWKRRKLDLFESYGLDFELSWTPILQSSPQAAGEVTANHELSFVGSWQAVDGPGRGSGTLQWWLINNYEYVGISTATFAKRLGIISTPNDGDLDGDTAYTGLPLFWRSQEFYDGLRLTFGQLAIAELVGKNRYSADGRTQFLNTVLSSDVTAAYDSMSSGLGVFAEYRRDIWYVSGMVADGSAENPWIDVSSVRDGNWQYALEVGYTPTIARMGEGNYRLSINAIDAIEVAQDQNQSGWGINLSFDQDLGDRLGAFARYSRAIEERTKFQEAGAGGLVVKAPLNRLDDVIGFAGW